jgi:hypothetical protein
VMRSRLKLGFGFLNLKMVCTPNSVEWMISTVYLGGEGKMPKMDVSCWLQTVYFSLWKECM